MIASAEGKSLVGGCGVILPRKFLNLEAPKRYLHHLSWDTSPKNRPRIRKWQTIAITITKMTESTEKKNPSTDSICLTQQVQGGQLPPCPPPPLAIALEWRWLLLFPTKMMLVTHKHCLVLRKSRTRSRHRGQRSLFSPMPIKNIPPPPLSPFCRPLTLTCIVCASFWSRVFLRDHLKRGLLWRKLRTDEQVNPHSHVLVQGGGGGEVLVWASFWVYNILK